ncbi:MAG: hypothetical protein LAT67_14430 [Balneolales bacterium]|nr:hypothetical protein [Balneolales bacterium]
MNKKKNILLVSGHPAQVHNFRLVREELAVAGYNVYWLATDKDISCELLNSYKVSYDLIAKPKSGLLSKVKYLFVNNWKTYQLIKSRKIDLIVSRISPYVTLAAYFNRTPHIALSDTETTGLYDTIFSKFINAYLTSSSFKRKLRKDQIRFKGNIELFYLHTNRFSSDSNIYKYLGLNKEDKFVIFRFVSWDAHHDVGLSGFSLENKIRAVKKCSEYAKVFITSENELPPELESYRISIPPEKMHDALAHATLFFGESATMASESAVLGRPAIYLDKHGRGYTDEEAEYGLVFNFKNSEADQLKAIDKAVELLQNPSLDEVMKKNHENFMADKIDMTAFMVWFIENWPESKKIMLENPDYQDRFK